MKLTDYLKEEFIIARMDAKDKESLINGLLNKFSNDKRIKDFDKVSNEVFEREKILSTGVGKGFALPHAKTDAVEDIVAAFCTVNEPVDYQALDDQPVNLVFLLVGKDTMASQHIKILSRISRMMSKDEFRESLLKAQTSKEIFDLFIEEEKNYIDIN